MVLLRRTGRRAGLDVAGMAGLVIAVAGLLPELRAGEPGRADHDHALRRKGEELFRRQWIPEDPRSRGGDGLGPVFNERSCMNCHDQGGTGGAGAIEKNIVLITPSSALGREGANPGFFYGFSFQYGPNGFEYRIRTPAGEANRPVRPDSQLVARLVQLHPGFGSAPAVLLHRYGGDRDYPAWREWLLGPHAELSFRISQRNPTPLFGMGRIEEIPDEVIEAGARRRPPGWPAVNGRVSRLADGRIGRYGWKAQTAALGDFVLSAAALEMGLHVPGHPQAADPRIPALPPTGFDMDQTDCDALIAFVRGLPAPVSRVPAEPRTAREIRSGKALFRSIGCAACHVPKLGDVDGLYSDLLLHEMADEMRDTGVYGALLSGAKDRPAPAAARGLAGAAQAAQGHARDNEWRTPPLWGLRESAPYLHDGRAATIDEAIRLHGGEAAASAQRFRQLSPRERGHLERFLLSHEAPAVPALGVVAGN